jgi:hypothetical protein
MESSRSSALRPLHDAIRDRVGLPFVGIAGHSQSALQLHAGTLLDHVRGFMCGRVQVRMIAKRDVITRCIGFGP